MLMLNCSPSSYDLSGLLSLDVVGQQSRLVRNTGSHWDKPTVLEFLGSLMCWLGDARGPGEPTMTQRNNL